MMSDVLNNVAQAAFDELLKNAVECTLYVTQGNTMKRDLAKRFNVAEADVGVEISQVCQKLCESIRKIKHKKQR
jgi:hypothetical protein